MRGGYTPSYLSKMHFNETKHRDGIVQSASTVSLHRKHPVL